MRIPDPPYPAAIDLAALDESPRHHSYIVGVSHKK
jgi:hypothetical protein